MLPQELKNIRNISWVELLARSSPWQTLGLRERTGILAGVDTYPYLDAAHSVFKTYAEDLQEQLRWKDFGVSEMGDMRVTEHTIIRQTPLTAHALSYDAHPLNLSLKEMQLMLSASELHDLGEAKTGDIIYDEKVSGDRHALELREAGEVIKMIDGVGGIEEELKTQLKETYLKITTSLEDENLLSLLGGKEILTREIDWEKLRGLFELYERYGYLITALQVFRSVVFEEAASFNKEEMGIIKEWNRKELKDALFQEIDVPEKIRKAVLTKNVLLNQWGHIIEAAKQGIPSARGLFDTRFTRIIVIHANDLMDLGLDHSFFTEDIVDNSTPVQF